MSVFPDAELLKTFDYDLETGVFTWKSPPKHRASYAGQPAGGKAEGYVVLQILRHRYRAHRAAWFFVYGDWPKHEIDHINGNRSDNRIANLRDVPRGINAQNQRGPSKNNRLGVKGVQPCGTKFAAQIHTKGETRYLGTYPTASAAHEAYLAAKRLLHEGCTQ